MKNSRSGIVYTALVTIFTFLSVAYVSCDDSKEAGPDYCQNVVCENGGYCIKGTCYCAAGYEGPNCKVKTTGKYEGQWEVTDTITFSTIVPSQTKMDYEFSISSSTADNRQFLIDNFLDQYSGILCQVAKPDSFFFSQNQAIPNSKKIIVEGGGNINQFATVFSGYYEVTYPDTPAPVKEVHNFTAIRKQ